MEENQKLRLPILIGTVVLGAIFLIGLRWVFTVTPSTEGAFFYLFDYAVGLTMIFLPCTLPLAFVIVPLAMGKGYARGFGIAVSFAIGVTITLSLYGAFLGYVGGKIIGTVDPNTVGAAGTAAQAAAERLKNIMYAIAGALGLLFALGDIGLTKFRVPTYSGAFPSFIQKQQEFIKAGLLGLFLGNVGVGCPNPLFNAVIVPSILVSGGAFQGWLIMLVQALGRVTPLFILAFLAILGVNATSFLMKHRTRVEHTTGWAMVFVAGFLFTLGAFTHDWYVYSGIHTYLESITQEELVTTLLGKQINQLGHAHAVPNTSPYLAWGSYVMVTIWMIPFVWMWRRRRNEAKAMPETPVVGDGMTEKQKEIRYTKIYGRSVIALGLLFYLLFGYVLPHNFLNHASHGDMHDESSESPVVGEFTTNPSKPQVGKQMSVTLTLSDDKGQPLTDLRIEHERLLHFIFISEDLSDFQHIHIEDSGKGTSEMEKSAMFTLPVTLLKTGRYAVAVNYLHKEHEGVVRGFIDVGEGQKAVELKKDLTRQKQFGDVAVTLNAGSIIKSGESANFEYIIKDANGSPLGDLRSYLGAPMHLAIWSFDQEYFLHTHGEVPVYGHTVPQEATFGPYINAHIVFPWPGLYKVFAEFSRGGKVYETDFTVEVKPGAMDASMMTQGGHSH
ncbi:MAG: cytochrome c biogenesis protein CcdA [Patescibacteria group bacterium]